MGLGLEEQQVAALETRTEGWAAGLQLAALSAAGRPAAGADAEAGAGDGIERFVAEFTGSHRFVLDYLVEEVLDTQPDGIRTFLLDTCVLDELTAGLCDALTGRTDGQQTLEALERANLFVIPLDDERRWWRYHHLFADALRARLAADDPDRVRRLHRVAAGWYAGEGRLPEAVPHALAGDDVEQAADLVELVLPGLAPAAGGPAAPRLAASGPRGGRSRPTAPRDPCGVGAAVGGGPRRRRRLARRGGGGAPGIRWGGRRRALGRGHG